MSGHRTPAVRRLTMAAFSVTSGGEVGVYWAPGKKAMVAFKAEVRSTFRLLANDPSSAWAKIQFADDKGKAQVGYILKKDLGKIIDRKPGKKIETVTLQLNKRHYWTDVTALYITMCA